MTPFSCDPIFIRKRTTLGRFAHESGVFGKVVEGKPLAVYMGDDSRGEYIYKFVSAVNRWHGPVDRTEPEQRSRGRRRL